MSFAYDNANRLSSKTLPNQVQTVYVYNDANQVTGLAWGKTGQAALGSLGYGYDSRGQLVAQTGSHAPQALPPASTNNTFDDNNRQTQANGNARSYDADGHLLSDGTRTYTWDDRDHLSQITQGGTVIASYSYDALGRRSARTENGTTTQYLYDGLNTVQETQGTTINPILTGPGIDERYARDDNGGRTYFLTDLLGSTRLLTDTNGNAVQRYDYDPYGTTTQSSTSYSNPYQYTGREHDQNGLYYYRARYYTPELGRFVSEDPLQLAAGVNSYSYVGDNPISFFDPYGLWTFQIGFSGSYSYTIGGVGFAGVIGIGAVIDGHGNIASYTYDGYGAALGSPGAQAGVHIAGSDGDTVCDIAGPFKNVSVGGAVGEGGSIDGFWGPGSQGQDVHGGGITVGGGAGASGFSGQTNTKLGAIGSIF